MSKNGAREYIEATARKLLTNVERGQEAWCVKSAVLPPVFRQRAEPLRSHSFSTNYLFISFPTSLIDETFNTSPFGPLVILPVALTFFPSSPEKSRPVTAKVPFLDLITY